MITRMKTLSLIGCRFVVFAAMVLLVRALNGPDEYFPSERDALIQLRDNVNSTFNLHGNWTGPPCHKNHNRWFGIVCSDWHVTRIVLEGVGLTGSLPATFLLQITFLIELSFRNNSLYGPLPDLANLSRLEIVSLSRNHFSGAIPLAYTELPSLISLELQENSLQGTIQPFDQQSLTDFNVSHNRLKGPIPETPTLQRFPKSSYDNNADLCGKPIDIPCPISPPPETNPPSPPPIPSKGLNISTLKTWMIAIIAAAAVLIPVFVLLIIWWCCRRVFTKRTEFTQPGGTGTDKKMFWSESTEGAEGSARLDFFDSSRQMFDLDELLRSSAEVIGKGKLGTTYKAVLDSGAVVTVKRLKPITPLSKKDYIQQMKLLGKMKHENLVEIISYYCSEDKLIIYEYIPDGSLFDLLHESREIGRVPLNWTTRLSMIRDVARGLSFLHQSIPSHKLPHGNLKSTNVLIQHENQDCLSKLADYGFFPLLPSRESQETLSIARSPEFCQRKKLTAKTDIYCFGIVLLEIITGKIPGENPPGAQGPDDDDDLSGWVRAAVNTDWSTDILDAEILPEKDGYNEMLKLTEIALECTDEIPEKRPNITEILRRIEEIEFEQRARLEQIT